MSVPELDISDFPIVFITFGAELTLADVAQHRENFTALVKARGPVVSIALIRSMQFRTFDAEVRKVLASEADALGKTGAFIAEYVVVDTKVERTLFTVYSWLRAKKTHPLRCFPTREAALEAARALLAARSEPGGQPISV